MQGNAKHVLLYGAKHGKIVIRAYIAPSTAMHHMFCCVWCNAGTDFDPSEVHSLVKRSMLVYGVWVTVSHNSAGFGPN